MKEFNNLSAYESWLRAAGSRVQIVHMSTTKRWSFLTGLLGGAKRYTVTFEEPLVDSEPTARGLITLRDRLIASTIFVPFIFAGLLLSCRSRPWEGTSPDQASEPSIVSVDLTCSYQDRRDVGLALCVRAVLTNNTDEQLKLITSPLDFYDKNGGLVASPNALILNFDKKHFENIETLERLVSAHETVHLAGCIINNLGGHTAHSVMYKAMAFGLANSLLMSNIETQSNCTGVPQKRARRHSTASPGTPRSPRDTDEPSD